MLWLRKGVDNFYKKGGGRSPPYALCPLLLKGAWGGVQSLSPCPLPYVVRHIRPS
jgi:hypothetical protein